MTLAPFPDGRGAQPPKRLLVAFHDVGPRSETKVDRLGDFLGAHVPAEKIALLVVPDHWGKAPVVAGSPFARRLRGWAENGAEIFVHGWFHRDASEHKNRSARFKAHHLTAGEGEFLGIDLATSRQRMVDGKRLIEDIIGRPAAGF